MAAISGLSAFPITPADAAGRVDIAGLEVLLQRLVDANVGSIGLLGSTGTYPYLSREERKRAVVAAVSYVAGRVPIMVGIGALRTDEVIALARDAKDAGASAGLLAAVSYAPLTQDEVFEHYKAVTEAVDLPLCIYNNPQTTHFTFGFETLVRVAQLPGVVAVKNIAIEDAAAQAAYHEKVRAALPAGFTCGYAKDWDCVEAMIAGGDAWYSVVGGLFPGPIMEMCTAAQSGDAARARELNARFQPLWDLFKEYSSLRVMYAMVRILKLLPSEPELPRPLLPLSEEACQRVALVLEQLQLS
jgi:4-hydroxy-tetrahydrodipicolinate synthase